jgi:translation initiation factor IF-1
MNILLSSFRRSGTHLTIDTIKNNFEVEVCGIQTEQFQMLKKYDEYAAKMSSPNNILLWTHVNSKHLLHSNKHLTNEQNIYLEMCVNRYRHIHVYRDGRDVAVSKSFLDLKCYNENHVMNTILKWKMYMETWLALNDCLFLKYEDYLENYDGVVYRIRDFLDIGTTSPSITNTLISNAEMLGEKKKKMVITSREFRKGVVGDYNNYFNKHMNDFFTENCGDLMRRLGYNVN